MALNDEDQIMAADIFDRLLEKIRRAKKHSKQYWDLVSMVQELANKEYAEAQAFMRSIDISKAPEIVSKTWSQRLVEGPQSTSFKGQRRQLQADPNSPHKTFGMRPHHARGLDDEENN